MSRATGTFQQRELRQKLLRLEQEIARSRAAAEALSREAEARLGKTKESPAPTPSQGERSKLGDAAQTLEKGSKG